MINDNLLYAFLAVTSIQLIYYVFIFVRVWFVKVSEKKPSPAVSLILSSKNQKKLLEKNLLHFINQDYPDFEIIVVNNASWDGTDEYLEQQELLYPNLKVVSNSYQENDRFSKGNKFAITLAVKAAANDLLLFADADCVPSSKKWLLEMVSHFSAEQKIVLANVKPFKRNGLFNVFLRFEAVYESLLRIGATKVGLPLLANRRNIAYHRNLFFSVNGFLSHLNMSSGEAELFVDEVRTSSNSTISLSKDTLVEYESRLSFSNWFSEKRAFFHVSKKLSTLPKFFLAAHYLSMLLFYTLSIQLIMFSTSLELVLGLILIRLLMQYIVYWKLMEIMNERRLLLLLPFYEFVLMIVHGIVYISTNIKKVHDWD